MAVFAEEERKAKTELYTGDASLGKRALQRVLMKKQLEQMSIELRELMVYQSPPELGSLHTDVEVMMKQMGKEQSVLIAKQMQHQAVQDKRRAARLKQLKDEFVIGVSIIVIVFVMGGLFLYVAYDRQQKYPQYGDGLLPRDPNKKEEKYIYIGR
jgi:t-SNARE complex subunit (syntaxin)